MSGSGVWRDEPSLDNSGTCSIWTHHVSAAAGYPTSGLILCLSFSKFFSLRFSMSGRYAALPNYPPAPDAERELADAFESDDEDEGTESTPLTHATPAPVVERPEPPPGAYDFERDYDYPPPGSPPRPSALALPNDFGNSNGQLPSSPIRGPSGPRPSLLRRALGGILPTHYSPVASADSGITRVGGGVENDGVFANVMAKPGRTRTVTAENGDVHMVPEDSMTEALPVSNF